MLTYSWPIYMLLPFLLLLKFKKKNENEKEEKKSLIKFVRTKCDDDNDEKGEGKERC